MQKRLEMGNGETVITLGEGQDDAELSTTVETLMSLEKPLEITVSLLREKACTTATTSKESGAANMEVDRPANGGTKLTRDYFLRKNYENDDFIEVRVAVVGNVDSGKSTLLGVLTHGVLDDGRGHARTKLFRHKHEIESGRTSSVGNDILGFDAKGKIVNDLILNGTKNLDWETICRLSSKVLTFIDLAGHEKYLKTTVFGMTGHAPDFCMLMVSRKTS